MDNMVTRSVIPGQTDIVDNIIARNLPIRNLLEIGIGNGMAARKFRDAGIKVTATGFDLRKYIDDPEVDFAGIDVHEGVDICEMSNFGDNSFDAVWCAHVLEHVFDTGRALKEVRRVLKPDGYFFVSVPPFKHAVVGGHVNPGWNVGILMYVLSASGFDLRSASFVRHGYNISAVVRNGPDFPASCQLRFSNGDIEMLARHSRFPENFDAHQGYDGNIQSVNWEWLIEPQLASPERKVDQGVVQRSLPRLSGRTRIALFIPWITQSRGGTENVGQMMANAMADRGHEVHVFTFDDKKRQSVWPLRDGIALHHLTTAADDEADNQMLYAVASVLPDLIVGLHMNRTFLRYVRCASKLKVPIVLSEHIDPRFPERIEAFTLEERLTAFYGATRIHLLVDAFRASLPDFLQDKIDVVPNTTPPARQLANPSNKSGRKTLITVARLVPRKNISRLLEEFAIAARFEQDWDLEILGGGKLMNALVKRRDELSLANRVRFVGEVHNPSDYLAKAHCFVLPSLFEGFPMSSLEAMAHGLPLVGYKSCNGINVQIVDGENGFLVEDSHYPGGLATKLREIMKNPQLRGRMGQASLKRYNSCYSNETVFGQWEATFARAIAGFKPQARPHLKTVLEARLDEAVFGSTGSTALDQ
ncbi:glycosyltransferase involved in cell wall biosynthesis/SAM-dependent methyltransferase [Sinorhizobium terangae]|uniref:Glycosyltransferase n=1 Tax=Sinorhizobium terangae TaxID=110322 RepID=A0A6N7LD85_SINTE|nr:glycosyltransferase [Sinorhizobium terangae]MBB4184220.1 glycosyltransferase involved in cell wall biosynthesis/SAM-dependent methyltransferase [Sinorhizobium terangae]MQX15722.1 glycosyltransferase [Sinorhizobium terangae]